MRAALAAMGVAAVDGIVFDLGVSSFQLDQGERGFSFQADGPLDMRMSRERADRGRSRQRSSTRGSWRGCCSPWRRAAGAVDRPRHRRRPAPSAPLTTTAALAAIVARAKGGRQGPRDPATRTFQALRMAVNDEVGELERGLAAAEALLRPGGRLAVVSFHSGEDAAVKALRQPRMAGARRSPRATCRRSTYAAAALALGEDAA